MLIHLGMMPARSAPNGMTLALMLLVKMESVKPKETKKMPVRAPAVQCWSRMALDKSHGFHVRMPHAWFTLDVAKMPKHATAVLATGSAICAQGQSTVA